MEDKCYQIITSNKRVLNTTLLAWSRFKDIRSPFPLIKKSDDLIITFDVNFTTQILTRFKKSKRFEDTLNLINQLHEEGLCKKEIIY